MLNVKIAVMEQVRDDLGVSLYDQRVPAPVSDDKADFRTISSHVGVRRLTTSTTQFQADLARRQRGVFVNGFVAGIALTVITGVFACGVLQDHKITVIPPSDGIYIAHTEQEMSVAYAACTQVADCSSITVPSNRAIIIRHRSTAEERRVSPPGDRYDISNPP